MNTPTYMTAPEEHLNARQKRWLMRPGATTSAARLLLYTVNRVMVRSLLRLRVTGAEDLPAEPPFILAPNHSSSLDAFVIGAALTYAQFSETYWAGRRGVLLRNFLRRSVNRIAQAIPISRTGPALAVGAAVLKRGSNLVWFPEGTRSMDGQLHEFKSGVALLAAHFHVPVVPVGISGTHEALPPGRRIPRLLTEITVHFGTPVHFTSADDEAESDPYMAFARQLRDEVRRLRDCG